MRIKDSYDLQFDSENWSFSQNILSVQWQTFEQSCINLVIYILYIPERH